MTSFKESAQTSAETAESAPVSVPPVRIRHLKSVDIPAIRHICFQTALFGESMEPTGADESFVTDLLLLPYFRLAAHTFWVAEQNGQIIGYLAGCLNTRHLDQLSPVVLAIPLMKHLLWRRLIKHPPTRELIRYGWQIKNAKMALTRAAAPYPAHLHINIHPDHQRGGTGRALLAHFCHTVEKEEISGIHLTTSSLHSLPFFQRNGFEIIRTESTPPLFSAPARPWHLMARTSPHF